VLVTRSGTPQFLRNNQLNANSFFFNSTGQGRPVLKQNQFGGNIGGPVIKNKTFFLLLLPGHPSTQWPLGLQFAHLAAHSH